MADHRYQQYCALARALEVVGNRWTMLIVRELGPGPRRFTDLVHGLPGISRKLLTERLRDLEHDGIIQRRELPPPAARHVYELTDDGRDLAIAMTPLIAWGARRMGERQPGEVLRARWSAVGLVALADREAAKGVRETYQYVVGDSAFHFIVDDGSIEAHDGHADDPVVVVTTDEETWADIASGNAKVSSAIAAGTLTITGDPQAGVRLRRIFSVKHILCRARDRAVSAQPA
ncbi:MAG: winged helix-turn-helix transcriptional regulator [Actinomycetota bacterium]|nr:winged helix-turn-helix transcriptional regulator [Actinomycetota bacterium]